MNVSLLFLRELRKTQIILCSRILNSMSIGYIYPCHQPLLPTYTTVYDLNRTVHFIINAYSLVSISSFTQNACEFGTVFWPLTGTKWIYNGTTYCFVCFKVRTETCAVWSIALACYITVWKRLQTGFIYLFFSAANSIAPQGFVARDEKCRRSRTLVIPNRIDRTGKTVNTPLSFCAHNYNIVLLEGLYRVW